MIKAINITPVYNEWENLETKKLTGFGIFIECGIKDADEVFNLLKKMADYRYSIETSEKVDDD